jgi:hypothetical protein
MHRLNRLISAAVLIALSGALAGCGGGGLSGWDPTDMLDFLDTKKKLPGDRKPVFPEGVPGLEQGVPKELYKGGAAQQEPAPQQEAAVAPTAEPKGKRGAKSKTQPKPVASAPDADAPPEEDGSTAAAPPAPKPMKPSRRRVTTPPADESGSAFPAPVQSGTFSR